MPEQAEGGNTRWSALALAVIGCGPQPIMPDTDTDSEDTAATEAETETETGAAAVPCNEADCGPQETCSSEFGHCIPCAGELSFVNDPPGSCQLRMPDLPPQGVPYVEVELDGVLLPYVDDCAEEVDTEHGAWTWLPDWSALVLCEQACLAFHSDAEITIGFWPLGCQ